MRKGCTRTVRAFLLTLSFALTLSVPSHGQSEGMKSLFLDPPQEARPRVWWHWMDGNITMDGIRKDLLWMDSIGIGGVHCFEAGVGSETIVPRRLVYMTPEWKEHFKYATGIADSLGMEIAVASCPGWSNTGGPWVKEEQGMKRLTWSETALTGGKTIALSLPSPPMNRWYRDTYVVAVREKDGPWKLEGNFTANDSPYWVQYSFPTEVTVRSLRTKDGLRRSVWAAAPADVHKWLEVSQDGKTFRRVCPIPDGGDDSQTVDIPATVGRFFRVVYARPLKSVPELTLYSSTRINHSEEKTGFATPSDLMDWITPDDGAGAVPLSDVVDLTGKMDSQGRLQWKAPKGKWTVYRFGYTLTGRENHPAPKEATGLEVTKMDKAAFTSFLEYYLDMYKDATGGLMGKNGLHYLLIDSYEAGCETWAPAIADEFHRRRGYSLIPWLPVLTGQIVESAARSEEFLFDWRTTIGELIGENMYSTAAEIAAEHGMETYFEAHENGRLYLVDGMSVKKRADIPMAAMWTIPAGVKVTNSSVAMAQSDIRESASVAHLYGKKLVACESMTANGWSGGAYSYYPGTLKPTADLEMASGVNRFVIHESAHQPVDDKKPGLGLMGYGQWFNRHETWSGMARPWMDYLARSSYMLQQGKNVADILYYYGEDDVITSLYAHVHPAVPDGYNFDYLGKDALLELISWDGEKFVTPSGSSYRILMISKDCYHMSREVSDKIQSLKEGGAPIFYESEVSFPAALSDIPKDFSAADFSDLRYVHRSSPEGEIYWVSSRKDAPRHLDATFRVEGLRPMLWQPETGKISDVSYEIKEGKTTVQVDMEPWEAFFIVFSSVADEQSLTLPERKESVLFSVDTPWTLKFDSQWGGPQETVTYKTLSSLSESSDIRIKYYSGTTIYTNTFDMPATKPENGRFILDLGQVGCVARVIVNGREVSTLWKYPYRTDVTDALAEGTNTLEVQVANQWVNRIIGDRQKDCPKKYTYTPARFYEEDSPLLPAGLMGPVRLVLEN